MNNRIMAMILAGGQGKRMGSLCQLRPKPMLPFGGSFRVIDFSLSNCIHSQIKNIGVLIDYKRTQITAYLREWRSLNSRGCNLQILQPAGNSSYSGTADAVFRNINILEDLKTELVLVLAGDHIYKMNYMDMVEFHMQVNAEATVGVIKVPRNQTHRFGTVSLDTRGRITNFQEKVPESASNLASMGIYIFDKKVLIQRLTEDALRPQSSHDFGYAILPSMVQRDRVFAYEYDGYWQDIGTIEAYYQANIEVLQKSPKLKLDISWPILSTHKNKSKHNTINRGQVINSLVGAECHIEGHVENSVLGPGVVIGERAEVINSLVLARANIGYHSVVDKCILDEGVKVGKFSYVGFGVGSPQESNDLTLVARDVIIPPYTAVGRRCILNPGVNASTFTANLLPSGTVLSAAENSEFQT